MSARARAAATVLPTVAALIVGVSWQAGPAAAPAAAQASPPTTKSLLDGILSKLLPTTTVKPPVVVTPPPASPTAAKPATAPAASSATTTTRPADAPRVIPPEYLGIINSVRRSGPRSTAVLFDALRPLLDLGISQQEAAIAAMGHFPVAGETSYTDDWLDPRFTPAFHLHQGTDLFAARGTPVRAPYDGVVRFTEEGAGGKAAYLTVPDGTYYYMAHLDGFARKFSSGSAVKQGDVVGYVGNTGNAFDSSPHVHFEIHPRGGAAVNPKPVLDGWLGEALAALPNLLASYNVDVPRAVTAAGILRRFEKASPGASSPSMAPLLWASAVSAGGGSLRLAELQVARVAGRIDWQRRATDQQAQADALREGRDLARALLRPLTPPAMVPLLGGAS